MANKKQAMVLNKQSLSAKEGVIIVVDSFADAEWYFARKSNEQPNPKIRVVTLGEDSIDWPNVDELIAKVQLNQLKLGTNQDSQFNYHPQFIIALDHSSYDQTVSNYLVEKLKDAGFKAQESDLAQGEDSVAANFKKHPRKFKQALANVFENPEDNINRFINYLKTGQRDPISSGLEFIDYPTLDGGFYEGLYILGASSGMGKSSLALQIADYIASQNEANVLYFAFEMSPEELIAKSLSRINWLHFRDEEDHVINSRNILKGHWNETFSSKAAQDLQKSLAYYSAFSSRMVIERNALNRPTADELVQNVKDYMIRTGKKPFVIIDYLQLVKAANPRMTDKQNISDAINKFKILALKYHLSVLVISSLNRINYYKDNPDIDSFKESGDIEYTADVIMTLSFDNKRIYVKNQHYSGPDSNLPKEISLETGISNHQWDELTAFQYARGLTKRPIKLCILKNRFGAMPTRLNADIPLLFYPQYSVFGETNLKGDKERFPTVNF